MPDLTLSEIAEELENRKAFRQVFCAAEGNGVLTWILDQCGYFSMDPQLIDPMMIAFANRLLNKIGVVHIENLFADTSVRLEQANDRDLRAREQSLKGEVHD
jgi:hypothetical protein